MTGILATVALLCSQTVDAGLASALEKAKIAERYAFKLESTVQGGENASPAAVEGRYEKDRPVWMKSGDVEVVRKGETLAVGKSGEWKRVEGRDTDRRRRGQYTLFGLRMLRLPHEELAGLEKQFKEIRKLETKEGDQTVYLGDMTEAAAKTFLAAHSDRKIEGVPGGTGRFWVTAAGDLAMVEIIVRVPGKGKRDSGASLWITLSEWGTARAEIPDRAIRALEEK